MIDLKSTGKTPFDWVTQYRISNQFKGYYISRSVQDDVEIAGVIVDLYVATPGNKKGKTEEDRAGDHFYRAFIRYDEGDDLTEFYKDYEEAVKLRDRYRAQGYWPKNTNACWQCPFTEVCDILDPDLRRRLEESMKRD